MRILWTDEALDDLEKSSPTIISKRAPARRLL